MDNKPNTINPNGLAILNALKAANAPLTFAEIADIAGIEPKTGYLTAAKKLARTEKLTIVKRENAAKLIVKTIITYPNGMTAEKETEKLADAYELVADAD